MSEQVSGGGQTSAPPSGASTPTQTVARSSPASIGTPASTPTPPTASPANTTPAPSPQPQTPSTPTVQQQQFIQQQQQQQLQQQQHQLQQHQLQQAQQQVLTPINITPVTITSTSNVMGTTTTGLVSQAMTGIRASLPQVQVIQSPFIHQQAYIQQQLMLQNAAVQAAMQAQAINPQLNLAVQGRQSNVGTSPKSPGLLSAQTVTSQAAKTSSSSPTTGNGKTIMATGMKQVSVQQQVAAPMIGGKPIMQRQGQQPLVIGQLAGFMQRGPNNQQTKTGVISSQPVTTLGTQSKTGSINPALMSQSQLLGSQLRISSTPTLVTNTGQLINTQGTMIASPAMINQLAMASLHQNLPMTHQALMAGTQGTTVLNNQPLYIRTTGPITQQQQAQLVNNLQQMTTPAKPKDGIKQQPNLQPKVTMTGSKPTQIISTAKAMTSASQGDKPGTPGPQVIKMQPQQQRQINRVTGVKKVIPKTTVAPAQVGVQARPLIQPKPGVVTTQPTMVVTPKFQQAQQNIQDATRPVNILPKPSTPMATTVSTVTPTTGQVQAILASTHAQIVRGSSSSNPIMSTTEINGGTNTVVSLNAPLKEEPKTEPMDVDSKPDEIKKDLDQNAPAGEKQKAIVKPHILTHFIEGFVIQEAAEPFQVQRSSLLTEMITTKIAESEPRDTDNSDFDKDSMDEDKLDENIPTLKCEFCGKVDYAHKFRRSKRFCSMACAKRYNVGCSKRLGLFKPQNSKHQKKKKKEVPTKKGWKRGQAGRVTRPPGPIERLQEAMLASGDILTDSQESEDSSAMITGDDSDNTDSNSITHTPKVEKMSPKAREHSHKSPSSQHNPALPSRVSAQGSNASSATAESSPMDTMSDDSSQDSHAYNVRESPCRSPPRSPPVLQPEVHLSPETPTSPIRRHPSLWTVMDVYNFIKNLPGCTPYADEFKQQEIDGQALMLLKEDHLMSAMNMKLGPALKICNKISSLKDEPH